MASTIRTIARYGWKKDLPDHRDKKMAVMAPPKLPPMIDLRSQMPAVYDQGQLGSCTANALAGALEFDLIKEGLKTFVPSRLFIYYNERVIEGTVDQDAGAELRDGCKAVATHGAPDEVIWPYVEDQFATKPEQKVFQMASLNLAKNYYRLPQDPVYMKYCLSQGYPFVFGFSVFSAFESDSVAATGLLNIPDKSEKMLGGHAVLCVGYDDQTKRYWVRNSWGLEWGDNGYFSMPYDYMHDPDLASDFWTIRRYAI